MHRSVWEFIAKNIGGLRSNLGDISEKSSPGEIPWFEIPSADENYMVIATDGSYNYMVKSTHIIFALTGLSLVQTGIGGKIKEVSIPYVGVLRRNFLRKSELDKFLSMWMRLAEIKSTLRSLEILRDRCITLMDGSFTSDIINPEPTIKWVSHLGVVQEDIEHIKKSLNGKVNYIRENLLDRDFVFLDLAGKIVKDNEKVSGYAKAISLYYEYMIAIDELKRRNIPVVFIAKDSYSSDYIKKYGIEEFLSDQVMFSISTYKSGFSDIIHIDLSEKKRELPDEFAEVMDTPICETFIRFRDNQPVYKVEIINTEDEDKVREILSYISFISPEGYPYPLRMVHRDVVIKTSDIAQISMEIFPFHQTSRRVLE